MKELSKISEAIAKVANELGTFKKDAKNVQQNYSFTSVEAMKAAIIPLLSKEGIAIFIEDIEILANETAHTKNGSPYRYFLISTVFVFSGLGEKLQVKTLGEAMDSGDKGINKATTCAYKNLLKVCFGTATADDNDNDHNGHQYTEVAVEPQSWLTDAQAKDIIKVAKELKVYTFKDNTVAESANAVFAHLQSLGFGISKKNRDLIKEAFIS